MHRGRQLGPGISIVNMDGVGCNGELRLQLRKRNRHGCQVVTQFPDLDYYAPQHTVELGIPATLYYTQAGLIRASLLGIRIIE